MTSDKVREAVMEYASSIGCNDDIVRKIGEVFDSAENTDKATGNANTNNKENTCNPKKVIRDMLTELGIPAGVSGYQYLTEAVYMVYVDSTLTHCIATKVYPAIATQYTGTVSSVERAIRHAIGIALRNCSQETLVDYFGEASVNGKIKNKEAITKLAERLEEQIGADFKSTEDTTRMDDMKKKKLIRKMLSELAIPESISGYKCMEDAIMFVSKDVSLLHSASKNLYPKIAISTGIGNCTHVGRSIRHAIEVAWRRCPEERLIEYFGETAVIKNSINNKDFIAKLTERLLDANTVDIENSREETVDCDKAIKQAIRKELSKIAIFPTIAGYTYIAEAVYIIINNHNSMKNFERYVFSEIAKKYSVEKANVSRAIYHAVKSTHKRHSNLPFWKEFKDNNIAVTTKTVIAKLVEELNEKEGRVTY